MTPDYTLDELVRMQDALDAMDDTSAITRQEFIECNKTNVQGLYAIAWDTAAKLRREMGSLAKAANEIARRIDDARRK